MIEFLCAMAIGTLIGKGLAGIMGFFWDRHDERKGYRKAEWDEF